MDPAQEEVPWSESATARARAEAAGQRFGVRDGACQAVMVGGGEQYLSAFALLLHATPLHIGLLSALPQLVGTWSQWLSVKALHRVHHRKPLIVAGSAGQALMWLPLLTLPVLFPAHGPWLLIACAVTYFAMGHFAVPAWNSLITDLVHPDRRGAYFAHRARVMAVINFAALCAAGMILHWAESWTASWIGFACVFLCAAAARAVSARYLSRIDETATRVTREADFQLWEFLRHQRGHNFRRFLLFSGLMHAAVLISGPYFVIYMLRDLHWTYSEYGAWLAAGTCGQFISYAPWGRLSDRYGNKKLLTVTSLMVPFLPMLYLVSTSVPYLLAVNFMGGIVWSGLSLGLQNYVFDSVQAEDRAKGVAAYNTVNAMGWFAGAMFGSWLAGIVPTTIALAGIELSPVSNLPFVFFISGALRLVISLSLLQRFGEGRVVEAISHRKLLWDLPFMKRRTGAVNGREPRARASRAWR